MEPGVVAAGGGLAHCWVLRDHAVPLRGRAGCFGASFAQSSSMARLAGVGGCGVWLLNSGREHLTNEPVMACFVSAIVEDKCFPARFGVCGEFFVWSFVCLCCAGLEKHVLRGPVRGVVVLLFLLSVCVTSYKGHMVDALASRADEGRTSLR